MTNVIGLILIVGVNDLIALYISIELQTLGALVLVGFRRNNEYSVEAALKYFVLAAMASCFLLIGVCMLYLETGTTNYSAISQLRSNGTQIGLLFVLLALLFKVGATPFHN